MPRTRAPELILAGLAAILLIGTVIGLIVGRDDDEAPSSSTGGGTAVDIADFAFEPADLTVSVGDTVTWTNQDSTGHTVTGTDEARAPTTLNEGDIYELTFGEAGEFPYACEIHPDMEGTVVVEGHDLCCSYPAPRRCARRAREQAPSTSGSTTTTTAPTTSATAFLVNAALSAVIAAYIVLRPDRLGLLAGIAFSAGTLVASFLSRRGDGILDVRETGLNPSPEALLSIILEVAAIILLAGCLLASGAAH